MSHHHHDDDHHHHHHHHHFRFLPRDPRLRLVVLILLATSIIYGLLRYVVFRTDHSRDRKKTIERVALDPEFQTPAGGGIGLEEDAEETTPTQLGILERPLDVFNFSSLDMAGLSAILNEEGLELLYPSESENLSLTVQEAGGRPLGEILAQMLSPHRYIFVRQDERVQILPASPYTVSHEEPEDGQVPPCTLGVTFEMNPNSACEFWIDCAPPIHLQLRVDPLYGEGNEEGENTVKQICTVMARRDGRLLFRQVLHTRMDKTASIQVRMDADSTHPELDELLQLTLKPLKCTKEGVTLELGFENKSPE